MIYPYNTVTDKLVEGGLDEMTIKWINIDLNIIFKECVEYRVDATTISLRFCTLE